MIGSKHVKLFKKVSRLKKIRSRLYLKFQAFVLKTIACFCNLLKIGVKSDINNFTFSADKSDDVNINIFGNIMACDDIDVYKDKLSDLSGIIDSANLSFATIRKKNDNDLFCKQIADKGIFDVYNENKFIGLSLYSSKAAKIGVISYKRFDPEAKKHHIKVSLMSAILKLKKSGADFIIININDLARKRKKISLTEKRLFSVLSVLGADYIFGVTPGYIDGGATYVNNGKIVRAIYSMGTFLSDNWNASRKHVVVKLRLRFINGTLQVIQESYVPLRSEGETKIESLLFDKDELVNIEKSKINVLSSIESDMIRLRPVNRMLTVDKLMKIIGSELPDSLKYLSDFSIGKACARSYECAPGDVFFFRQPFNDPNDLVPENVKARIKMAKRMAKFTVLVVSYKPIPVKTPYIIVDNAIEAHISTCAYLRSQFPAKYVGITGSVGKTSVKDLLYEVVSTNMNAKKSERNSNVQVKIGIDIQKLTSNCDIFIQELGGGRPGGASRHSRMILPEITVLTNIGDAHIGNFGCREKLMENKLGIGEGMPEGGVMLLNADDPLLSKAKPNCNTIFYARDNKDADYYAEDIIEQFNQTIFTVVHNHERTQVVLNVLGEHNVLNAVCCFAIGEYLGISKDDIVLGLSNFKTSGIRQNLNYLCGVHLFMDCYNASSESMKSSMEVLSKIKAEPEAKRISIIGDITGMGELAESVHKDVAETVMNNPADHMIFFGKSIEDTYKIVSEKGYSCFYTNNREELNSHLKNFVKPGDVIMAKGSSKVLLEYSIDSVFGTRFTDERLIDEVEYRRVKSAHVAYNVFEHFATAVRSDFKLKNVHIKKSIAGITVTNVAANIAHRNTITVHLPDTIRHISAKTFKNCSKLILIRMPAGLKFIADSAFENCTSIRNIQLYDGLLHIGSNAFAGCTQLQELYIPETVAQIGDNAFENCDELTIYCKQGSYADKYLTENNISHKCR